MSEQLESIILAAALGGLIRALLLRSDYRQYPTYPHGYVAHLAMGFIAAALGAVALPALINEEYVAVTFLALAAQQFRDIRNIERETLTRLDGEELIPRGKQYIEGIARAFEARNYIVMGVSFVLSGLDLYWLNQRVMVVRLSGLAMALLLIYIILSKILVGKRLADLAKIKLGEIRFEGPNLFVDDIHFMNLALEEAKETYLDKGLGLVFEPQGIDAAATLANVGQRQAIAHTCARLLGSYRDVDTAEFTPLVRRDIKSGRMALVMVAATGDKEALLTAIEKVPVLEGAISRPSTAVAGRERQDYGNK